jgi:uncharacterized protein involved in type VI secretion and phage assembly
MGHAAHELTVYQAILVPKIWYLSLKNDCKNPPAHL